ncbi:MAG: class I SAM-dependent methyltransferase [Acidiferrobacterales bacterium]
MSLSGGSDDHGSVGDRPQPDTGSAAIFNRVAAGYDREVLRFFPFAADRVVVRACLRPGYKVLDVATGTGAVAIAAAQAVGPGGRVVAIDLAEEMLERAQAKFDKFGVANVDLHVMDAGHLEFRAGYFDAVVCSQALFLLPDMEAAIRDWTRVLKPGGMIVFSSFGTSAFQPMTRLFLGCVRDYGSLSCAQAGALPTQRLAESAQCLGILQSAGLLQPKVAGEQLGYHLRDAGEWWEVIWNSGLRTCLEKCEPDHIEMIRQRHVAQVKELAGADGLWMDVLTLFSSGNKP